MRPPNEGPCAAGLVLMLPQAWLLIPWGWEESP
jgi:hypothetical protein